MTFDLGRKILIIDCSGSGKTTFAQRLSKILKIPVVHMDRFYWQDNWQPIEENKWHDTSIRTMQERYLDYGW